MDKNDEEKFQELHKELYKFIRNLYDSYSANEIASALINVTCEILAQYSALVPLMNEKSVIEIFSNKYTKRIEFYKKLEKEETEKENKSKKNEK